MTCRQRGEPYGVHFGDLKWLSNSRLSLEAAEFARKQGMYDDFHHAVFTAYFTDGLDIGNKNVLLEIGERLGLDRVALDDALESGEFAEAVRQGSEEAKRLGVTAVPSFFIEDLSAITGAVAEERFREALKSVESRRPLA